MKEIFTKLFSNPNFPYIIGGIIAALTVVFIIVWVLGKKDKKKIEATQVIPTVTNANLNANNTLDPSLGIKPAEESVTIAPVENLVPKEDVSLLESPSEPVTPEYIPDINPEDIPYTPKEEMYVAPEPEDEEVYRSSINEDVSDAPDEVKPIKFDPNPEIEPYIPETSVQNFQKVAEDIEKDLNVIENMNKTLNVAPVEVINSEAEAINPMPVGDDIDSLDAPSISAPKVSQPVFSAVNPPVVDSLDGIELPKMK